MNILMLGWELPPHNSGGLGVACYQLSKALALLGAKIDFVIPYSAPHPDIDFMTVHSATNVSSFKQYGLGAYDSKALADIDDQGDMRSVQRRYKNFVEKFVKVNKPDIIHAHDWLTMEAGIRAKELTGAPLVIHVHSTEFDRCGTGVGTEFIHEIERRGLMAADRILAVSNITKNVIVEKYGIPADKIEVVYNTIDTAAFDDGYIYDHQTYRYLEALKNEGYTIVSTITRFTIQKGLTHFLRAAARASEKYDKFAFLLVGDGEQRDELIMLAADLGISDKVFFTGFIRGKQWRDAYNVSDIFVMSSVSEPFGLTALEAAHHNNALIISKQSGVGEVLSSVFRYDFWDIDKLADQLVRIATSPAIEQSLKQGVAHEYDVISWHDIAQNCLRIYESTKQGVIS